MNGKYKIKWLIFFVILCFVISAYPQKSEENKDLTLITVAANLQNPFLDCAEKFYCGDWFIVEIQNSQNQPNRLGVLLIDHLLKDESKLKKFSNKSLKLKIKPVKSERTYEIKKYQSWFTLGEGTTIDEQIKNGKDKTEQRKIPMWRVFFPSLILPFGESLPEFRTDLEDIEILK